MVLGVRDLYIPPTPSGPSKVYCFPGAKVRDIQHKLPSILACHAKVDNIVHVGTNDIRERRSTALRKDFTTLITTLMGTGKRIVISGPLPTYRKGAERWSRLFWLHTWLKPHCASLGIPYVDNFNLFWERPSLLKHDGLHPNRHGARLLSDNITTTLKVKY
uniref:SGNH hydrolase-type esterase domain-containing protein n=1 Tax=Sander lucioperca TaxID=283035 RepID=A0A8C9ZCD1_SANLU